MQFRQLAFVVKALVVTALALGLTTSACAASNKKSKIPARTAASSSSDQKTFSLVMEPKSHPFCNRTEQDTSDENRRCEAENVHALLAPSTCLPKDADPDSGAKWDLAPDPFVPAPYWKSGLWSNDLDLWKDMDQNDIKCLAGRADIVLERAFKYGFCNDAEYALGSSPKIPNPVFGLDDSDYYLLHIVVWKGTVNKLAAISSLNGLKQTTSVQASLNISTDGMTKSYSGSTLADLIKAVNQDKDFGAKATLTSTGRLKVTARSGASDFTVAGANDAIGNWTNPVEGPYSVDSSRWYSYNHGDHGHWYRQRLDDFSATLRIYGTKKPVGLVALYVKGINGLWDQFDELKIQYKVEVKTKTAANISDLTSAISIITTKAAAAQRPSNCSSPGGPKAETDGFYGATFIKAKAPADLAVSVQVDFPASGTAPSPEKPATPKPGPGEEQSRREITETSRLKPAVFRSAALESGQSQDQGGTSSSQPSSPGQNPAQPSSNGATSNGNNQKDQTNKSDQTTKAPTAPTVDCQPTLDQKGQQTPCKMTASYNDEDLYHWDVSFGVPFKTLNDIQYQTPSGNGPTFVPKSVTRLNAFGFFDVYPVATDITDLPLLAWPHFKLGLPISGKVFNKPFFGAGDGFNLKKIKFLSFMPVQVQFFGGVDYNKEFRQIPGTKGATNVAGHRVWKGMYGIEIPVGQFKGLLSSGKKDNSKSNSNVGNSKNNSGANQNGASQSSQ